MIVCTNEGNKEFSISVNISGITSAIHQMFDDYEDESFVRYGTSPEFGDSDFEYINKEEYEKNLNDFEDSLNHLSNEETLKSIINNFPRKKSGFFNRKNIKVLSECNNCIVIHEWHNTWIYYILKVVALNDNTLKIELFKKVDTPA